MNDIYKTPESKLAAEPEPRTYDLPGIKRYRWMMLVSLAAFYFIAQILGIGIKVDEVTLRAVQGFAGVVNMVMFAILAAKIYQKTWVVLFCIVLSLLPIVNLIACIFMNIKAKEVINYWGRRRYTLS